MLVASVAGIIPALNYSCLRCCLGRETGPLFYFILKWYVTLLFLFTSLSTHILFNSLVLFCVILVPIG